MTSVVVVESPAKAKTIDKYLGSGFHTLASFGHVRDLPAKDGSVRPEENFAMDWQADERGNRQISAIVKALKGADKLYLATDPDREGEAISWHVLAMLKEKQALKNVTVYRITFNEITKSAVQNALKHPRELDQNLIDAYLARRALDYLVGFTLSPVLWRKLPGSRSAGRVQSVALRLICDREAEIEVFQPREYWTIQAVLQTPEQEEFLASLSVLEGKKLDKFALPDEASAQKAAAQVRSSALSVLQIERKRTKRNPAPPFTTSTLQQEAARKLGFSAQKTMKIAQQLYEGLPVNGETVGLITYMRTDGVQMAAEALQAIRSHLSKDYGPAYLPEKPRFYTAKAKNAQEAHEAIRPVNVALTPELAAGSLSDEHAALYTLIWKRAVASQMQSAEFDRTTVDIASTDKKTVLRASGSVLVFDGFLKLYREGLDDKIDDEDEEGRLPRLNEKMPLAQKSVTPAQHFTEPPPRFSEASLVKQMEELGIGRPSTYASVLAILRDRQYVKADSKRFIPEERGRLVTAFLKNFFARYVDVNFTANLEEQLDDVSGGRMDWHRLMNAFWQDFSSATAQTKDLKISDVISALNEDLADHFFPQKADGSDPRTCPSCKTGRLSIKLGKFGAFIGCENYPECRYTPGLPGEGGEGEAASEWPKTLGTHPDTGEAVTLNKGPYGFYVQCGEEKETTGPKGKAIKVKPKRIGLPPYTPPQAVTFEQALNLLQLPKLIGLHPETQEKIEVNIGRFGPYIKMGSFFASPDKDEDLFGIGLNRAVDLLAKKMAATRLLGEHPEDKNPVFVKKGRFGPYVQHNKTQTRLPKDTDPQDLPLSQALELLAQAPPPSAAQKTTAKKTAGKKATVSKTPAKKNPADKAEAKKTGTPKAQKKKPA